MSITEKILVYLESELSLDSSRTDIIRYGLQSVLLTVAGVVAVIIPAAMLGLFQEAIIVLLTIMTYRKLSGGAHCSTPAGCLITGTAVALTLSYLATKTAPLLAGEVFGLILVPLFSLPIVYIYAPADVPQKPITSKRQRRILRILTFFFLIAWVLLGLTALLTQLTKLSYLVFTGNLGIIWQTFLLTPTGFRFIHKISHTFFGHETV